MFAHRHFRPWISRCLLYWHSRPESIGLMQTKVVLSFCSDTVVEEELCESLCHCLQQATLNEVPKKFTAALALSQKAIAHERERDA